MFWQLLQALPLVEARDTHREALASIEKTCLYTRKTLERASKSVTSLGMELPSCLNYASLNLIAVAAQQCKELQEGFGGLRCHCRGCMWVKEVVEAPWSNCLKDDVSFWKLLLSHRQVLSLLEATDDDRSWQNKTLAVNLENAYERPVRVPFADRHKSQAKQHAHVFFGNCEYDLSRARTLLIRGFEMGFCDNIASGSGKTPRRLLFQSQFFEKVAQEIPVSSMIATLTKLFVKCLQHLRALDTDHLHMDRSNGQWVSENYDVWVWAKAVL